MKILQTIVNATLLPLLIAAAIGIAMLLVNSREQPQTSVPPRHVPAVEVTLVEPREVIPEVESFGVTRAYLNTELSPQVAGEIVEIGPNFDAGRTVKKGELLARIDPTDYEALLAERESALAQAETTLTDERTRARIAEQDWAASGRKVSEAPDFALRKPQLAAAEAQVRSAQQAVEKARADVKRTEMRAPYDAVVTARNTAPGNQATIGAVIGTLISDRRLEIELPLSPRQLRLFDADDLNSGRVEVTLTSPNHPVLEWKGKVDRVHPEVDATNRTVRVIVAIEDSFPTDGTPGFVGTFLNARIPVKPLPEVIELEESQVVTDSFIWTVSSNATLQSQSIEIVHAAKGIILARLTDPPKTYPLSVVKRPLPSFEDGMAVTVPTIALSGNFQPEEEPES